MAFCDYCLCEDCRTGSSIVELYHAKTSDGTWICDICYKYDECMRGPNASSNGPCEILECEHRPKIISKWREK